MADPLIRAREIHEAADLPPWQEQRFVHNTYAALLDAVEALKGASHLHHSDFTEEQEQEMAVNPFFDLWEAGKAVCPACDALATLEARIKEETDE